MEFVLRKGTELHNICIFDLSFTTIFYTLRSLAGRKDQLLQKLEWLSIRFGVYCALDRW